MNSYFSYVEHELLEASTAPCPRYFRRHFYLIKLMLISACNVMYDHPPPVLALPGTRPARGVSPR